MANLNPFCKFFELSMDKRRHPSAISLFGSMLPLEELSLHSTPIFLNEAEVAGSGICSLTIIFTDKHDFSRGVSRQFFCFWTPLNFDIIYNSTILCFSTDRLRPICPPFCMALSATDSHGVNTKSEMTPYYAARPSTFGNIEPWMILEGTIGLNEPCICLKRLPWQRINRFEHVTKDWTF